MKRSEMLNLLFNSLGIVDSEECLEKANKILKIIENAGMLPPLNEQNYHHMDNQSRLDANEIKWYHNWEEEE